jgi:hypothetical protein
MCRVSQSEFDRSFRLPVGGIGRFYFTQSIGEAGKRFMTEKHSRLVPGGRAVWHTKRLWECAAGLPVQTIAIADIPEFDQDCWFGTSHPPTCRAVAEHARRIQEADLKYPIILSADGGLMDGGHRIAKAWLNGQTEIAAVRFATDPDPDYVLPDVA